MVVKDHVDTSVVMNEMIRRSEESVRRIRYLEEYVRTLENKIDSLESGGLSREKEIIQAMEEFRIEMEELNNNFLKIDNDINNIKKALSKYVKKTEIVEIQSYIDLISPLKSSYVTKNDVEHMINGAINGRR